VLKDDEDQRYKITLKAQGIRQSQEQMKLQMNKNINSTVIKVRIKTFKTLRRGRILIETGSEREIRSLSYAISTKGIEPLEFIEHQLRKPKIIIYLSRRITKENSTAINQSENPEIILNAEVIIASITYKTME
jgi:hypothetical protein